MLAFFAIIMYSNDIKPVLCGHVSPQGTNSYEHRNTTTVR
jgi:hypothetical protein